MPVPYGEAAAVIMNSTPRSLSVTRFPLSLALALALSACGAERSNGEKEKDVTAKEDITPSGDATDSGVVPDTSATDTEAPTDDAVSDGVEDTGADGGDGDTTEPPDDTATPDVDGSDGVEPPDTTDPVDTPEPVEDVGVPDVSSPDLTDEPDVPEEITGKVALELNGTVVPPLAAKVTLSPIVPGPGIASTATFVIRNAGEIPFTVAAVELLEFNSDGSPANPLVVLGAAGKPLPLLPADVLPATQVPTAKFSVTVSFSPASIEEAVAAGGGDASLRITFANADIEALTARISVPQFIPELSYSPSSLVFNDATLSIPETQEVFLENLGNAPLSLVSIGLAPPSERFTVAPLTTTMLEAAGSAGSSTVLSVTYKPIFSSSSDVSGLVITTNDPDQPLVKIPLSATFEATSGDSPCVISFPGQETGALDFSDAKVGVPKLLTVQMENAGTGVCTLNGVTVPEDPTAGYFHVATYFQGPAEDPQPIVQYPLGVGPGYKILIDVTYSVSTAAKSATLQIDFTDPDPQLVEVPMIGGGPKPCFAMAPGTENTPELLEFAGNIGSTVTRHIAIYSCGDAPVGFGPLSVLDPEETSPIFSFDANGGEVAANGVRWFPITATFEEGASDATREMTLPYSLSSGPAKVKITLRRRLLGTTKLPTADPGNSSKYPSLVAGQPFTLDGTASLAGTLPLLANGYVWTLVSKPSNSTLIVQGPAGPPLRVVTPDVPGSYTFSLVVKTAGSLSWHSPEKLVTVSVN